MVPPLSVLSAGAVRRIRADRVAKRDPHGRRLLLARAILPPVAPPQPYGLRLEFGHAPWYPTSPRASVFQPLTGISRFRQGQCFTSRLLNETGEVDLSAIWGTTLHED